MKNKILLLLIMFLSLLPMISCDENEEENVGDFSVTYILNRKVEIKNNPQRIVCLGPNSLRYYTYVGDIPK